MSEVEYIGKVKYIGLVDPQYEHLVSNDKVYRATSLSCHGQININLDLDAVMYYAAPAGYFEIIEDPDGKLKQYGARYRAAYFKRQDL